MRFHIVTVPVERPTEALEELNAFLARHRVLSVDRQLIHDGAHSAWSFCVTWVPLDGAGAVRSNPRRGVAFLRGVAR